MFSFLVFNVAQLGTSCWMFGHLSEGNYLCDIYSGQKEIAGTSFCDGGPSGKSGVCEGSSRKL